MSSESSKMTSRVHKKKNFECSGEYRVAQSYGPKSKWLLLDNY